MRGKVKRNILIGTTVAAVAAAGGGAYAATSGGNSRQAFLNDVAKRLNVSPQQLTSALRSAYLDQLQAAVRAGKLTQAQADQLKQHLQKAGSPATPGLPAFRGAGGPGFGGRGHGGGPIGGAFSAGAAAAERYLGLNADQLRDQLRSGKSLAAVATARGKTSAGLQAAITAAVKSDLDQQVSAKQLSAAQETRLLSRLQRMLPALIAGRRLSSPAGPAPGSGGGPGAGHGFWGGHGPRRHAGYAGAAATGRPD